MHGAIRRWLSLLGVFAVLCVAGCSSFPAWKGQYSADPVLIMPPRDVVQGGVAHQDSPGTGAALMAAVKSGLEASGWKVVLTDDPRFSHTQLATAEDAIAEARRLSATYVLLLELGEFRNAAPMTFRSDFVTLASAVMYEAATGQPVWRLERPLQDSKSNFGSHMSLITALGKQVARSIAEVPGKR